MNRWPWILALSFVMGLLLPVPVSADVPTSLAAKARTRTLASVSLGFPYKFVVIRVRGTKMVGVAGTMGSGDYACFRGSTRSGKLRSGDFVRARGRGSGSSFRITTYYDYPYRKPVQRLSMTSTTLRELTRLSGSPGSAQRWLKDVGVCASGGEVGGY
jgi:hypothetical protein